jgi:hypothetical protein
MHREQASHKEVWLAVLIGVHAINPFFLPFPRHAHDTPKNNIYYVRYEYTLVHC